MNTFLLTFHVLMVICGTCKGAFFPANSYTLTGVVSVNGSDADGGCPQECVREENGVRKCDCMGTSSEGTITGVLIDGMIPTIDTSQRGNWASQLFTIEINMPSYALGFRFQSRVALQEVELYVLYCPAWQIGATTINVYDSVTYPSFIRTAPGVGSVNLTSNMQNCSSLTRVSIPLQTTLRVSGYFIEFTNPTLIYWLHIAEVRFSDQPIPTLSTDPTDPVIEPDTIPSISETTTPTHPQSSQESTMNTTHSSPSTMNTTHITITTHFTPSTPNTTHTPVPTQNTTSLLTITTIILIVVIAVLVLVVAGISVSFTAVVYAMKTKSRGGVVNEGTDNRNYDDIEELSRSCEVIETKRNEAYSHVSGGRRSVGVKMVRNEECATCAITADGVHVNDVV